MMRVGQRVTTCHGATGAVAEVFPCPGAPGSPALYDVLTDAGEMVRYATGELLPIDDPSIPASVATPDALVETAGAMVDIVRERTGIDLASAGTAATRALARMGLWSEDVVAQRVAIACYVREVGA